MSEKKWIKVRTSVIHLYHKTALYYKNSKDKYILYKDSNTSFSLKRVKEEPHPILYINSGDKEQAILELQDKFNAQIQIDFQKGNIAKVKENFVNIVGETLNEPRAKSLRNLGNTVDLVIEANSQQEDILKTLLSISEKDYTTALHSVNVMALILIFGSYLKFPKDKVKLFGLSSLFHDLGKTQIPNEILTANRRLSDREFSLMRAHPIKGYNLLKKFNFRDKNILRGALEHHEKLDGSGYPYGTKNISEIGQIMSIIDIYEAITNDDRPYRNAMEPMKALEILKKEQMNKKINKEFFEKFAYSLL
ncbi:MAG: HD domain-containing protein [Candidatus Cloacimonadota bacterium]|nr:HD domain-containing protein [Candidatus Cloacimonadota bacterium]